MIVSLLYGLASLGIGYALMVWMDPAAHIRGISLGIAALTLGASVMGFMVLLGALAQGSLEGGTILALIIATLIVALDYKSLRARLHANTHSTPDKKNNISPKELLFCSIPILLIILFILHGMLWTTSGPLTSFKGWGDGAYHLGMVMQFVVQHSFALTHPFLGNTPLIYTFFINLTSALLLKGGAGIGVSWYAPLFLYAIAFVLFLYQLGKELLHKKTLAFFLVLLSLLGAGMGYIWFFKNIASSYAQGGITAATQTILNPPYQYTQLDNRTSGIPLAQQVPFNIQWIVPIESFFSHQRSFIPGVGLGMLLALGMWLYRNTKTVWKWVGGVGILPLIHSHSFLALSVVAACVVGVYAISHRKMFRDIGITAIKSVALFALLAVPQILYIQGRVFEPTNNHGGSFMRPWFGWMMCTHTTSWITCAPNIAGTDTNIIFYWIKNFGVVFIGWIIALAYVAFKKDRVQQFFAGLSGILFIIPNIMIFQPWEFDNNKFIFYWWIAAIITTLMALVTVISTTKKKWVGILLISIFLIGSFPAGIIDTYSQAKSFITGSEAYAYYGPAQERAAQWIQTHTDPRALFLTAPTPDQFVPLITGRQLYIGYEGWLWSQGGAAIITRRTNTIHASLDTQDPVVLCADGVRYIVDDMEFQKAYPHTSITPSLGKEVYNADGIAVYALTCQ